MAIYFTGHELGALSGGSATPFSTHSSYRDANYSRVARQASGSTSVLEANFQEFGADGSAKWVQFGTANLATSTVGNSVNTRWVQGLNSAGEQTFALGGPLGGSSPGTLQIYGRDHTLLGSSLSTDVNTFAIYTVEVADVDGDTRITLWSTNSTTGVSTQIAQFTESGASRGLAKVRFAATRTTSSTTGYFSEVVIADEPTLGWRVRTLAPAADGHYTDWSNGFAAVDEATPDTLYAEATAAGQKVTYNFGGVGAILGTNVIKAVAMTGLLASDTGLKRIVRQGGVDSIATLSGVPSALGQHVTVLQNNPVTGQPWGTTDLSTVEFGYETL
jgi:hypothetical protein